MIQPFMLKKFQLIRTKEELVKFYYIYQVKYMPVNTINDSFNYFKESIKNSLFHSSNLTKLLHEFNDKTARFFLTKTKYGRFKIFIYKNEKFYSLDEILYCYSRRFDVIMNSFEFVGFRKIKIY